MGSEYMHSYGVVRNITENRAGMQYAFNWILFYQASSNRVGNIWDHKVEFCYFAEDGLPYTSISAC